MRGGGLSGAACLTPGWAPDFGKSRGPSEVGPQQLAVEVRVRGAVQGPEPLSCGLRLRQRLSRDLERPGASLLASRFTVRLSGRLVLGLDRFVPLSGPVGLQSRALSGAAGQVVVGRGVSELGAGLPAAPHR